MLLSRHGVCVIYMMVMTEVWTRDTIRWVYMSGGVEGDSDFK